MFRDYNGESLVKMDDLRRQSGKTARWVGRGGVGVLSEM